MSHEKDFAKELEALRENLPTVIEGPTDSKSISQIPYSLNLAQRIVNYALEGLSLRKIALKGEMPAYTTLLRWSKEHPEFSKMFAAARKARALHYEESAIAVAENTHDKDEVPAARLLVETYKWAAEVNDPEIYGKKIAHSGDAGGAQVVLNVVTGFGPPNKWQTPPKLKPDGTIDVEATDYEVSDGPSEQRSPKDDERDQNTGEAQGSAASDSELGSGEFASGSVSIGDSRAESL